MRAPKKLSVPVAILLFAAAGCSPVVRSFGNTGGSSSASHSASSATGHPAGTGGVGTGGAGTGGGASSTTGTGGGMKMPLYTAGTRLRPVVQDAGGGAVAFVHWQDNGLNVPCQFLPTSDSLFHCVPTQAYGTAYADSGCNTLVAVPTTCATTTAYAVQQSQSQPCEQTFYGLASQTQATIYNVGAMAGMGQTYELQGSPPQCVSIGNPTAYYNATQASFSSFVAATLKKVPVDARLDAEVLTADDGTTQVTSDIYDHSMNDQLCSLGISGNPNFPDFICLPGGVAATQPGSLYTDATCTTQYAEQYTSGNCPPASIIEQPSTNQSSCNLGTTSYFTPGNAVTPSQLCYMDSTTMSCFCNPYSGTGNTFYKVGAMIPTSTFASFKIGLTGTGRLQAVTLATSSGADLTNTFPGTFWDTMQSPPAACSVKSFTVDGALRCVPDNVLSLFSDNQSVFADSACLQPVAWTYVDPTCPTPTPTTAIAVTPSMNNCGPDTVTNTYPVTGPADSTQLYMTGTTAPCIPYSPSTNTDYFVLGPPVADPSTLFATVTQKEQ